MDVNLNTLKQEILDYLPTAGFSVFYGHAGGLEGSSMVLWDVEHQPDYRAFLDVARAAGCLIVIFGAHEFNAADLDTLLEQLEDVELTREERRDYESRLRDLRGYEGSTCSLELAFDYNSRLYVYEVQPDWYEEFLSIEDDIAEHAAADEDVDDDETLGGFYSKN